MLNFFHNIGVGIVSAFIAFGTAFHSQETPITQLVIKTESTTTTATINTPINKPASPIKNLQTAVSIQPTPVQTKTTEDYKDTAPSKQSQYNEMKAYETLVYKSYNEQNNALNYLQQASDASNQKNYSLAVTYSKSEIDSYDSAYNILLNAQEPTDLPLSSLLTQQKNIQLKLIANNKQKAEAFYDGYTHSLNGESLLAVDSFNEISTLGSQGFNIMKNEFAPIALKVSQAEKDYFQGFDLSFGLSSNTN